MQRPQGMCGRRDGPQQKPPSEGTGGQCTVRSASATRGSLGTPSHRRGGELTAQYLGPKESVRIMAWAGQERCVCGALLRSVLKGRGTARQLGAALYDVLVISIKLQNHPKRTGQTDALALHRYKVLGERALVFVCF